MLHQNIDEIYTGQISFTLFYIFGMWQPITWNSRWKIWLYQIYSIFMIIFYFSFSVSLFVYLLRVSDDMNIFTEYLYYFLYSVAIFIKQLNIIAKRRTVIESKNKLLASFCRPRDFYEWNILEKCSKDCRYNYNYLS